MTDSEESRAETAPEADAPFEFDADTHLIRVQPERWRGEVTPRWSIGRVPNGGYVMALACRALQGVLPHPDPLSITGHYLKPAGTGKIEVAVEVLRRGRTVSTGVARIFQAGQERAHFLASFADLGEAGGAVSLLADPPDLPPPEGCLAMGPPGGITPAIVDRFDLRLAPRCAGWLHGEKGGPAEIAGWIRFADNRPLDTLSLTLFSDAFPPAVFNRSGPMGWVPTLELTVHVRARPAPGWLRCVFRTRFVTGGHLEEDGEIWDADGNLVAQSRQLAKLVDTA